MRTATPKPIIYSNTMQFELFTEIMVQKGQGKPVYSNRTGLYKYLQEQTDFGYTDVLVECVERIRVETREDTYVFRIYGTDILVAVSEDVLSRLILKNCVCITNMHYEADKNSVHNYKLLENPTPYAKCRIAIADYITDMRRKLNTAYTTYTDDEFVIADDMVYLKKAGYIVNDTYVMPPFVSGATASLSVMLPEESPFSWYECECLHVINKTNHIKCMRGMFSNCIHIGSFDLREFSTRGVTDMSYMFFRTYVTNIYGLNDLDMSTVTDMMGTFACTIFREGAFRDLKLTWNMPCLKDAIGLFFGCTVDTIDMTACVTPNLMLVTEMFMGCAAMRIDCPNLCSAKTTVYKRMFYSAQNLVWLDVHNWDISGGVSFEDMFKDCSILCIQFLFENKARSDRDFSPDLFNDVRWNEKTIGKTKEQYFDRSGT